AKLKTKNRSGNGRVFCIQRNERIESFQRSFNRKWIVFSSDIASSTNWIFACKLDIRESGLIQVPDSHFPTLRTGHNAKTLLNGRRRGVGAITVIAVAGKVRQIEDLPIAQGAVAEKVELSCADAADGHADAGEFIALIDFALTFGEKAIHPGLGEIL